MCLRHGGERQPCCPILAEASLRFLPYHDASQENPVASTKLTTRSVPARPDSLTRRNGTLIAAKFYGQYDKRMIAQWWSDSIRELFPDATIHKTTVCPRWYTVRCYFSL